MLRSEGELSHPVRIGVVLSSGGGRGVFAHTGFLLALQTLGIEVSAITGCSAGALVGGIFASGTKLEQWSATLACVQTQDYWTPDPWLRFLWNMLLCKGRGYSGFSDTRSAIAFIQRNLSATRFEDCRIPFYSLAMNLSSGGKTLFAEGDLAPRIMASAAMPVLYRPIELDGEWYCDGAVIELSPTEAICCRHDLDVLIVHHTAMHREGQENIAWANRQPWTLIEILYLLIYRQRPWYLSDRPLAVYSCPCGCGAAVIVIEPDLPELSWPITSGGPAIQSAAMAQTLALWQSHAATITALLQRKSPTQAKQSSTKNSCSTND